MRHNSTDSLLRQRAEQVIPGGMYGHQSTAMLPEGYPQFFARAEGARLWDVDGHEYVDFMCAYGPNLLGYRHREVDAAARAQMEQGDTLTGPTSLMVELAEAMVTMVSHADWAMFCKNGTDATTIARSVARAHTGRNHIIRAAGSYHGAAPWSTPLPGGVSRADRADQTEVQYNNSEALETAVAKRGEQLAAIFATPYQHDAFRAQRAVNPVWAQRCRELCDQTGALLVIDDVRAGLRMERDCSWAAIGVQPDLSTWGKTIANGHPISAILGSDKAREAATTLYTTGSFWFSAVPMAAALKTLEIIRNSDYLEVLQRRGQRLRDGIAAQAEALDIELNQSGPAQMPLILFPGDKDLRIGNAWALAATRKGAYLHPWHNMFTCSAMTDGDIDAALGATERAFADIRASGLV